MHFVSCARGTHGCAGQLGGARSVHKTPKIASGGPVKPVPCCTRAAHQLQIKSALSQLTDLTQRPDVDKFWARQGCENVCDPDRSSSSAPIKPTQDFSQIAVLIHDTFTQHEIKITQSTHKREGQSCIRIHHSRRARVCMRPASARQRLCLAEHRSARPRTGSNRSTRSTRSTERAGSR